MYPESLLPRIQLDDELLVDDGLHLFTRWDVHNLAAECVTIDCEPVGHGSNLCKVEISQHQLAGFWFVFDRDLVPRFHIVGSDVHCAPVHQYVPMRHKLARSAARVSQSKAV